MGVDLIVLDLIGTLIVSNDFRFRRPKVVEFLDQNPGFAATIYTDGSQSNDKINKKGLAEMGLTSRLTEPFFYGNSMAEGYKNLLEVAEKFRVNVENIVMVGDGKTDIDSAMKYGSKLVVVPPVWTGLSSFVDFIEGQLVMPMDIIGNLDKLLCDDKVASFFYSDGHYQCVKGDYSIAENVIEQRSVS
jgi:predicted HAD superfamily phosphohydrolase YqeG